MRMRKERKTKKRGLKRQRKTDGGRGKVKKEGARVIDRRAERVGRSGRAVN